MVRLILLSTFAALGIALAVVVATHSEPPPEKKTQLQVRVVVPEESELPRAGARGHIAAAKPTPEPRPAELRPAEPPPLIRTEPAKPDVNDALVRLLDRTLDRLTQPQPPRPFDYGPINAPYQPIVAQDPTAPRAAPAPSDPKQNPFQDDADPAKAKPGAESLPTPKAGIARGEGDGELIINIPDRPLREVLDMLSVQAGLNILAMKSVSGNVSASLNGVDVHTALEAILKSTGFVARHDGNAIYVGTPADFKELDAAQDNVTTRVYRPNYVTAQELQTLITPMLTDGIGRTTVGAGKTAQSSLPQKGIASDSAAAGGNDFAGGDVLLVIDYENVLRQVDQVVSEVDRRPQQVSIEAAIISVKLDDKHELGVDFEVLRDSNNARIISGSPPTVNTQAAAKPFVDLATLDVTKGGLKFGFLDANLATFVNALENVGETSVIASPGVMVLNKQRAEILIGSKLGYVSTTVTENAATQSVDFLEVGTQLRIRPFISADGMIRMEIHPELSTGSVQVNGNFTLPNKDTTQVTSNIMCLDGSTVVIGGLIREDLGNSTTQIPVLGSLPWVGWAFRKKTETTSRHEVIILITPKIVFEPVVAQHGREAKHNAIERQEVFADKMSPLGKRYFGRQYLRKARAAWTAGDAATALRQCNLAIHYDPVNLDATKLRDEIVNVSGVGDATVHGHLREGLTPIAPGARDYSRDGYPWKDPSEFLVPDVVVSPSEFDTPGNPRVITVDPGAPQPRPIRGASAKLNGTPTAKSIRRP